MENGITKLLGSKKGVVCLLACVAAFFLIRYAGLTEAQVGLILSPVVPFQLAQGWADKAKK